MTFSLRAGPLRFTWFIVLSLALTLGTRAQTPSTPGPCGGYILGFFNGVRTDEAEALNGLYELRTLVGSTWKGEPVVPVVFYNFGDPDLLGWHDLAETFIQRAKEVDSTGSLGARFELIWEAAFSGDHTFLDRIARSIPAAALIIDALYIDVITKAVAVLSRATSAPPTAFNEARHRAQLDEYAKEGKKLMLVAHSQGNLFVNVAYDYILPKIGRTSVAVAHVAPASLTLRGEYVLADIDLIINGLLRLQGLLSVRFPNVTLPISSVDRTGHSLVQTYLDPSRRGRSETRRVIADALDNLTTPICTIAISTTPNPSAVGVPVTLKAEIPKSSDSSAPLPTGSVTFKDRADTTLCVAPVLSAARTANCEYVFTGTAPRVEGITANYAGDDYHARASSPPHIHFIGEFHWRAHYRTLSCTGVGAGAIAPGWYWEDPCKLALPLAGTGNGTFFFDDVSPTVVFQDAGFQRTGGEPYRSTKNLSFRSSNVGFSFEVPTAVRWDVGSCVAQKNETISINASRIYDFTISSRSASVLNGTFSISAKSAYVVNFDCFENWRPVTTSATGEWTATLLPGPRPDTRMNGFDFCLRQENNTSTGFLQMSLDADPTVFNPRLVPTINGFSAVVSGCDFGTP